MSELFFAACFFSILFLPCLLAARSISAREDQDVSAAPEILRPRLQTLRHSAMRVVQGRVVRARMVRVPEVPAAEPRDAVSSGDFGDLQYDYERQQQRLLALCARRDSVAHRVA